MDLGDADLEPIRVLGEGTFGKVFLCCCNRDQKRRQVCVKRIIVSNPKHEMRMIQEEVYIISQLKHPRIVQFIRSFVHAGTVNIVMEYVNNGTMRNIIDQARRTTAHGGGGSGGGLTKQRILNFLLDMLMGLEYLHMRHVTHRDIKPENLLLDQYERIKYADFGISGIHQHQTHFRKRLGSTGLKTLGTPLYAAPEILRNERFDFKSDIWSLGCVFYEICTGQQPFGIAKDFENLRYLTRVLTRPQLNCSKINEAYGPLFKAICERTIVYELKNRLSLPSLIAIDPMITLPYYERYFEYNYF